MCHALIQQRSVTTKTCGLYRDVQVFVPFRTFASQVPKRLMSRLYKTREPLASLDNKEDVYVHARRHAGCGVWVLVS